MSVVYAGLVMYDAQGVRREVGIHAKTLNRLLLEIQMKSMMKEGEDKMDFAPDKSSATDLKSSSFYQEPNAFGKEQKSATQLVDSGMLQKSITERNERINTYAALKESIGQTEVEVIAGALLGFLVSLTVYAVM